jgi:Na+-translocating ferredoxin:NAD+ oxidoreductase subunit D
MKFSFRPSPNNRSTQTTQSVMLDVTLAMSAILAFAMFYYFVYEGIEYGIHLVLMLVTSLVVAIGTEAVWAWFYKKPVFKHLNTSFPWVISLIYIGTMGINKPLFVVAISTFAGVFIGKLIFGGFGYNIFNPAGVARAVTAISFGGFITTQFDDIISGATAMQAMQRVGWVLPDNAVQAFLEPFGGLTNLTLGLYPSSIGETSAVLIALAGVYLVWRKVIDWKVPVTFIGSIFIFTSAIALIQGMGIWYPIFHVVSGGAMFAAVFMLTDPVTTPSSSVGRILYAIGVAFFVVLIRIKANLPEGVVYGILFMNMLSPLLDTITDGWTHRMVKKYVIQMASLFVVALITLSMVSTTIAYQAPSQAEPEPGPGVVVNLGDRVNIFDEEVIESVVELQSSSAEGDVLTLVISAKGYALLFSDYEEDPQPNVFEIKINTANQTIVSVAYVSFADTKNIGDKTDTATFLEQFEGLSLVDDEAGVDVVTSATVTSISVIRAVRYAIELALEGGN